MTLRLFNQETKSNAYKPFVLVLVSTLAPVLIEILPLEDNFHLRRHALQWTLTQTISYFNMSTNINQNLQNFSRFCLSSTCCVIHINKLKITENYVLNCWKTEITLSKMMHLGILKHTWIMKYILLELKESFSITNFLQKQFRKSSNEFRKFHNEW